MEEMMIVNYSPSPADKASAALLGFFLGLFALPKTLYKLSQPMGPIEVLFWYNVSNQGVTNTPDVHEH